MRARATPLSESDAVTEDALLDGRIMLRQPASGYRVAADSVLLAAAVPAGAGERVFEPGAGTGAAALCLARRVDGCRVSGIELQPALVRLAVDNVRLNGLADRIDIMQGDVARPLPPRIGGGFDHAMINPPFGREGEGSAPPDPGRAAAHVETGANLDQWIACALGQLRAGGSLTVIHRADRLDELLAALTGRAGGIVVFPLWPSPGRAARRVIVRARKGVATPLRLAPGLVLHADGGGYSAAADAALRGGALEI